MAPSVSMELVLAAFILCCKIAGTQAIGVNYGRIADNLPAPDAVAQLVKSQNIGMVRIFDADPAAIQAFARQGIPVAITLGNGEIAGVASSQAAADGWIAGNVMPYGSIVSVVIVGNEVIKYNPELNPQLVPAMNNIYTSLVNMGVASRVKVSTAHAMDILDANAAFPPSAGMFRSDIGVSVMQPVLDFLARTGSYLLLNAYPYFAYRDDKGQNLALDYSLLQPGAAGFDDSNSGLHYSNLLDAQLDTVYSAMRKLNHDDVGIVLSESGWPSAGDFGASLDNAATFNRNLIQRVAANAGTPLKPNTPVQAYIFSLFNENQKPGVTEQNFGVFRPDMSKVYDITF
ncbi:glucan endo-1,3-beta-glucosidase 14 [Selaginella moellendorffii]|nr:glucan endo-1,3-beta-glucosidase 14 [Selaginella moellendorffii]|eukprot:XP_002986221.2 glucan endo-1,3-beta-glucosidase 14 [Selaginella moellendorffii]